MKTLDEEIPQEIKGNNITPHSKASPLEHCWSTGYTVGAHVTVISGPHNGLLGKV